MALKISNGNNIFRLRGKKQKKCKKFFLFLPHSGVKTQSGIVGRKIPDKFTGFVEIISKI